jgi:DNA-binding Lrp family transcriptional regulator
MIQFLGFAFEKWILMQGKLVFEEKIVLLTENKIEIQHMTILNWEIYVPKALVLIDTDVYSAEEVLQKLRACEEVIEAFQVTDIYDVVGKIEAKTFDHLVDILNRRIRGLFQVQETLSMTIVDEKPAKERKKELILV